MYHYVESFDSLREIGLLPCPFCGGMPKLIHIGNEFTKKRAIEIKCRTCRIKIVNAAIRYNFKWLEDISQQAWNNRVTHTDYKGATP